MYARILEFVPKLERREEFIEVINHKVLPILKEQNGFLKALLLFQINSERAQTMSPWTERTYAEPHEHDWSRKSKR